ncbi:glycosyltransferase involved in cell wall biosynthesis [Kitasatospora sp. GP30]|uniref:glycosyltransferase family 2 protein n=1 Tax=Kitasatospora sp. GP30 TaxID=3035084 RepID=UPI000C701A87|nr:glycosyltransferase family 2 protein [Kitasatospora sp. GP30]MDH6144862.1 glycosyltransferase involved in cell wall biosynthesis [Kitasatospora sp. GP30]
MAEQLADDVAPMGGEVAPVSVVIAAYNAAPTLGAALASALGQVPRPAQVIVVDDGSQDGTARVAAAFPEVLVVRQRNQGPSAARNAGIRESNQPWVAFLDADDLWLPGKLARQLAALREHPHAVLLAGDWVRTLSEDGIGAVADHGAEEAPGQRALSRVVGYRDVLVLNRFQTSTVLVRAEVLGRVGGFDPALDGAEDWDLWLRCARHGTVVKLDAPLAVYRDEPGGYSKDLGRLYARMLTMLGREGRGGVLPTAAFAQVLTWHYLRFAVAFALAGQRTSARTVLTELRAAGLARHVPAATARYLAPFLGGRALRRLRGRAL